MFVEWNTLQLLAPEIVLVIAASAMFVAGAFTRNRGWWAMVSLVTYAAAGVVLAGQNWPADSLSVTSGPVLIDPLALGIRWLALLMGLVFTLATSRLADEDVASEYFGCIMLVTTGVMVTAVANELVLLFLGLELLSVPTYVLLFLGRRDRASGEATMKYFFLSILSSALLLYGFCLLFGLGKTTLIAGTPGIPGIREALSSQQALRATPLAPLAPLALVLIMSGLGFRLAIAPLQFYAPDVYQGTTSANAGLLAVAPKIAGVVGLTRLAVIAMPATAEFAWQLALILSLITMTIGNVCALWQRNVRRLLAYSSIAHGGYLLIGLAAAAAAAGATHGSYRGGITSMLLYVLVYALATMGAFAALAYLGSQRRDINELDELSGLATSQPLVAGALAVFMFSLAGLPPLAGFWGKLNLFGAAIELATGSAGGTATWFTLLCVVAALNAAIAAAYYLRVVAVMYFQSPAASPVPAMGGKGARFATLVLAGLVLGVGAWPSRALEVASEAETVLRPQLRTVQAPPVQPIAPLLVGSQAGP